METEVQKAKAVLKQHGYYVDNLWSTQDVTDRYECTEEQAQEVLDKALTNEYITEQVFLTIDYTCEYLIIELKEE